MTEDRRDAGPTVQGSGDPRSGALLKLVIVLVAAGALWIVYENRAWLRGLVQPSDGPAHQRSPHGGATDPRTGQIAPTAGRLPPWEIPGTTLDEATVNELLPNIASGGWLQYDPVAIVRPIPRKTKTVRWPEHPGGQLVISTNNMGFREDEDTQVEKQGRRIIVIGDSHTFGLVNQSESFANVLERRLQADADGAFEVINAGVSGTGPYEYEGAVRKFLGLDPDVIVVAFYSGNDFSNAMAFSDFFSKRRWPPLGIEAKSRIDEAREVERERLAQSLTQTFDYSWRPSNSYTGLAASIERLGSIATMCREHEVGLVVALLPSKEDADAVIDADYIAEFAALLDLSEQDMGVNQRLTAMLATALRKVGIQVVDLLEPLQSITDRRLYWKKDHHLNVDGHKVVAQCLEGPVRQLLDE